MGRRGQYWTSGPFSGIPQKPLFNFCRREGLLQADIAPWLPKIRTPHRLIVTFDAEYLRILLKSVRLDSFLAVRNHTIAVLAADTGARIGALLAARLDRLSMDDASLRVISKGNREHTLFLGRYALRRLRAYMKHRRQTRRELAFQTTFKAAWADDSMYFGIKSMDRDTKTLNITATKDGDANVWLGDCVELPIGTQTHSYYQIAISPSGAIVEADRENGMDMLWSSGAEVASHVGEDYWSLEVHIRLAGELQQEVDRLNALARRKPNSTYAWYFNLCRQRVRQNWTQHCAFSPRRSAAAIIR